jgi:hypothetical protein
VQLGFLIVQMASGQLRNTLLHNCQAPADTSSATGAAVRFESKIFTGQVQKLAFAPCTDGLFSVS